MAKSKKSTEIVEDIVRPVCDELGLILWDVRFEKEGPDWFLRVFIDKDEEGVTIDDCEKLSRAVDPLIDEADPIKQAYYFEVSSTGLGRKLTKNFHFENKLGEKILIKLIRPIDNDRELKGSLKAFNNGVITIDTIDKKLEVNIKDASFIKLCPSYFEPFKAIKVSPFLTFLELVCKFIFSPLYFMQKKRNIT